MTQAKTWVGLDVHVSGTVAAVLDRDSGELRRRRLPGRGEEIAAFVAGLAGAGGVAYEGGATGFAVARGPPAGGGGFLGCAPGVVPRGARDRGKNRERDA